MKIIVDACTGPGVAKWLQSKGWQVYSVFNESPGWPDKVILEKANRENWVVVTNDKDFGELVFRDKLPHRGVILLRLDDETPANKIAILARLLSQFDEGQIQDSFLVATERGFRLIGNKKT